VLASGVGGAAEALQSTLGEGPSYTAHRTGRPVEVPDLRGRTGWVLFGAAAERLGIRAAFSLPLGRTERTLGAVTFYRRRPGALTDDERDAARCLTTRALEVVTGTRGLPRDLVLLAGEPSVSEINQATGVVGAQLHVDMGTALALLRGRAIGTDRTLCEVSRDVLDGHLQLADDR
jgi:hypothetical protein